MAISTPPMAGGPVEVADLVIARSVYTPGEVNRPAFAMLRTGAGGRASNYVLRAIARCVWAGGGLTAASVLLCAGGATVGD